MPNVLVNDESLISIGDAIRSKSGSNAKFKPGEMAQGILDIPAGGGGDLTDDDFIIGEELQQEDDLFKGWGANVLVTHPEFVSKFKFPKIDSYNGKYIHLGLGYTNSTKIDVNFHPLQIDVSDLDFFSIHCAHIVTAPRLNGDLSGVPVNFASGDTNLNYEDYYYLLDKFKNSPITGRKTPNSSGSHVFCQLTRSNTCTDLTEAFEIMQHRIDITDLDNKEYWDNVAYSSSGYGLENSLHMYNLPMPKDETKMFYGGYNWNHWNWNRDNQPFLSDSFAFNLVDGAAGTVSWTGQDINLCKVGWCESVFAFIRYSDEIKAMNLFTSFMEEVDLEVLKARYNEKKDNYVSLNQRNVLYDGHVVSVAALFSRYNHASAVETLNSLPDTVAYGGGNTIHFYKYSGALTDGGACGDLTAEEIAVAADKGWTVAIDENV